MLFFEKIYSRVHVGNLVWDSVAPRENLDGTTEANHAGIFGRIPLRIAYRIPREILEGIPKRVREAIPGRISKRI